MISSLSFNGAWAVVVCSLFVLISLVWALVDTCRTDGVSAHPGLDPFSHVLLALLRESDAGAAWRIGLLWFFVSIVTNLVIPVIESGTEFLWKLDQLIQAINYSVAVPSLFGVYIYLVKALERFLSLDNLTRLGLTFRETGLSKARVTIIWFIVIALVAIAIDVVITYHALQGTGYEPWVANGRFTIAGVFYYSMRGINAFIVLGLLGTVLAACGILCLGLRAVDSLDPQKPVILHIVDLGFKVDGAILKIGSSVVFAYILAGVVIFLEVSSEVTYAGLTVLNATTAKAMFIAYLQSVGHEVSWLIFVWIGLYLVGLFFVSMILGKLKSWITLNLEQIRAEAISRFESQPRGDLLLHPDYWNVLANLRENIDRAQVWPVPTYLRNLAGASVVGQFVGPLVSAYLRYVLPLK